jgi:hypothetical protein
MMLCENCLCMCAKRKSIKNPKITAQRTQRAQRTACARNVLFGLPNSGRSQATPLRPPELRCIFLLVHTRVHATPEPARTLSNSLYTHGYRCAHTANAAYLAIPRIRDYCFAQKRYRLVEALLAERLLSLKRVHPYLRFSKHHSTNYKSPISATFFFVSICVKSTK